MTNAKVSILIPTFNRAEFVTAAVSSALAQNYSNLEVIVSDNFSSDSTLATLTKLEEPRLAILARSKQVSMYENFNSVLAAATGQYVLMLSDDDVLAPDAITSLIAAIENNPLSEVAFGGVRIVYYEGGEKAAVMRPSRDHSATGVITDYLAGAIAIYPCGTLLSRQALLDVGGYDDAKYGIAADVAAWMLVANRQGTVSYTGRVIADYMVHAGNETVTSSVKRWKEALKGISSVLSVIDYDHPSIRDTVYKKFLTYKAECIGRSQSVTLANSPFSVNALYQGLRILNAETGGIPSSDRLRILCLWIGRIARIKTKRIFQNA